MFPATVASRCRASVSCDAAEALVGARYQFEVVKDLDGHVDVVSSLDFVSSIYPLSSTIALSHQQIASMAV